MMKRVEQAEKVRKMNNGAIVPDSLGVLVKGCIIDFILGMYSILLNLSWLGPTYPTTSVE